MKKIILLTQLAKMTVSLCSNFRDKFNTSACHHNDEERALESVYTHQEIEFSLSLGYTILQVISKRAYYTYFSKSPYIELKCFWLSQWKPKFSFCTFQVFEVYQYSEEMPFLAPIFKTLASSKLKYSGFPASIQTDSEKEEFVERLNKAHGFDKTCQVLKLEVSTIEDSPPKRAHKKGLQNWLAGKFCQSNAKCKIVYVHNQQDLIDLFDKGENVIDIDLINSTTMQVTIEPNKTKVNVNRLSNVIIGAMITSVARCRIYQEKLNLDKVGCKVHYMDTDSLIYSFPDNITSLPINEGYSYGQLKPELPSGSIQEYCSLGSKSYSLIFKKDNQCHATLKISGLSLESSNVKGLINVKVYNRFVRSFLKNRSMSLETPQIRRKTKKTFSGTKKRLQKVSLSNSIFPKRLSFTKKDGNSFTLPYGYTKKQKNKILAF